MQKFQQIPNLWKDKLNRLLKNRFMDRRFLHKKNTKTLVDMPKPTSVPFLGTKLNFIFSNAGERLHEYIDDRHKQLGEVFCESMDGKNNIVFISDPVQIKILFLNLEGKYPAHILPEPWMLYEQIYGFKRGLFFMNGEEWLSNRRVMNRHLLREDSDNWLRGPIKGVIDKCISKWKSSTTNGKIIPNLESDFYRLSTNAIIAILIGNNSNCEIIEEQEKMLDMFSDTVKNIFDTTTKLFGLPLSVCEKFNLKPWKNFRDSVDSSLFLAQKIVREILLKKEHTDGLIKRLDNEDVKDENIIRLIADFVIAAGDTTAYTAQWILYLLSQSEEVKTQLRVQGNSYAKNIIKEAMRLYPVAPFLTRILPKQSILGQYQLEPGTPVVASIYSSGRDERNFSKANTFLPNRWDRNDRAGIDNHVPSASLPFAMGARSCIGKKIALTLLAELATEILNNFDMKCLNDTNINAKFAQVLVPDKPIQLELTIRN